VCTRMRLPPRQPNRADNHLLSTAFAPLASSCIASWGLQKLQRGSVD
jgi:hypothetical protein